MVYVYYKRPEWTQWNFVTCSEAEKQRVIDGLRQEGYLTK